MSSMSVDTNTSSSAHNAASHTASSSHNKADSRFACNICLEPVLEPVVTLCGHLYCWPCLYRWLEPGFSTDEVASLFGTTNHYRGGDESRRFCPVCKTKCSVTSVVPIYVRTEDLGNHHRKRDGNNNDTTASLPPASSSADETSSTTSSTGVRRRQLRFAADPIPSRPAYSSSQPTGARRPSQQQYQHNLAPPPEALSLQQALLFMPPPMEGGSSAATQFLSRLLIMLGSFVILCLLLF